jgi:hypothetical protein
MVDAEWLTIDGAAAKHHELDRMIEKLETSYRAARQGATPNFTLDWSRIPGRSGTEIRVAKAFYTHLIDTLGAVETHQLAVMQPAKLKQAYLG